MVAVSELLETILRIGVHVNGHLISRSGKQQNWLIDLRPVLLDPAGLESICQYFWNQNDDLNEIHIAGVETAAIPLVVGLVSEGHRRGKNVSGLMIRKSRKRTGLGRLVEGNTTFHRAVIVDDVLNSGKSLERARVALRNSGISIEGAFVIIDYKSRNGLKWRQQHQISVAALLSLTDLGLTLAEKKNTRRAVEFREAWRFAAPGGFPYFTVPKSAPLLVGNRIFFGSDSGTVWCIAAATGATEWKFEAPACGRKGIWSSPTYYNGHLFIGAYNGVFYCLDAATGSVVWQQSLCEWIGSSPVVIPRHNVICVGLEYGRRRAQGSICALSLRTGDKVWEKLLRVYQHGSGTYAPSCDLVVFGTNDHNVLAIEASSGRLRWRFDTRRSVKYAPAIDEKRGIAAFASFDGSIYVVSLSDGQKLAEFATGNICYTTPLIFDGRLYCGSGDKTLYIADLTEMRIVERLAMGARVYSSPRQIDGSVIFGTSGGVVREIDPRTFETRGELIVPDAVVNAVAVSQDNTRIFVPTAMNEIYAFDRHVTA